MFACSTLCLKHEYCNSFAMLKNSNKNKQHRCVSIKNDEKLILAPPEDLGSIKVYHKVSDLIGGKK